MKLVAAFRNFAMAPKNHTPYRIQTNTPAFTASKYTVCWPPYKEHGNVSV